LPADSLTVKGVVLLEIGISRATTRGSEKTLDLGMHPHRRCEKVPNDDAPAAKPLAATSM